MKKLITLFTAVLMTVNLLAQSPEKMSYQAIIRDASNNLIANINVGMKISIIATNANGTTVYAETHTPVTNDNGLITIEIGTGTTSDDFSNINWGNGNYFVKTETDPTGGTNYTITSTSQLVSVPFALHSKTAENVANTSGVNTGDQDISGITTNTSLIEALTTRIASLEASINPLPTSYTAILSNLEYPKALFINNNDIYFTQTAARNTSFGGALTLNKYNTNNQQLTTLKNNPTNSDALVVLNDKIYLSSYVGSSTGNAGKVSIFDTNSNVETSFIDIDIATKAMCINNSNIYILGSSDDSNGKSLYKLPNNNFNTPEVLLTGLGRVLDITSYNNKIYFSDHNNIYEYSEGNSPKIIAASKSGVLGMALRGGYLYYSSYFTNQIRRINLTNTEDELVFDNVDAPGKMQIDYDNDILYVLTSGTASNQFKDGKLLKIKL